jgi:hypothetical protein
VTCESEYKSKHKNHFSGIRNERKPKKIPCGALGKKIFFPENFFQTFTFPNIGALDPEMTHHDYTRV